MVMPERYPILEGIPYLRSGRKELAEAVLHLVDEGDTQSALVRLLQDQDDWANTPPPSESAIREVLTGQMNLRESMGALNFGPVADYFAYRWSDPTFLSGLALLQAHLPSNAAVLELGCGIGHYLREFELRGVSAIGSDVVFAKLWLARRYVASQTPLVCFDAGSRFPFADASVQAVFCHDAFYFLPQKKHVASEMRRVAGQAGVILIGHAHNAAAENLSSGEPLTQAGYLALFPGCAVYDDAELTQSWIEGRAPRTGASETTAALAFAPAMVDFRVPVGEQLRLNPLFELSALTPSWPSERYREEYAALSGYLTLDEAPTEPTPELIRRRVYLSLPENW